MILLVNSIADLNRLKNLDKNINKNEQDPSTGNTLLHRAFIKNFSLDLKEELLKFGLDPNVKNLQKQGPIFYAKNVDDVRLLLKYGSLITDIDIYGRKSYDVNPFVKRFLEMNERHFAIK